MAVFYNTDNLPRFKNPVITIGTFDGVHKGHNTILQQLVSHAKEVDGESIVLTFEPHPRKLLFPDQPLKLLTPLEQKLKLITKAGIDHIVVVPFTKAFASYTAEDYILEFLVKKICPHSIIIGYDHRFGHDRAGNIDMLKKHANDCNYKVYEIPAQLIDEAAVSSTKIRHALQDGQVKDAAHMLGRAFSICGKVVTGAKLGRTIGYPTANIEPLDTEQLIPANGVYAVRVGWKGETQGVEQIPTARLVGEEHQQGRYKIHDGMLNIGIRPTVSNELTLHIEAHLFDFNGNIYDKEVEVFFVDRLRDEQKFSSLDALKEQLGRDMENAKKVLK